MKKETLVNKINKLKEGSLSKSEAKGQINIDNLMEVLNSKEKALEEYDSISEYFLEILTNNRF